MQDSIYRQLAQRLDAIPNGFPSTQSGVELRLLAKMFSPQEARLASIMRLSPEPAADLAARVEMDQKEAHRLLKEMAAKGLIYFQRKERQLGFGLLPFVVGSYEASLARMDAELAQLFEQYFQETHAGITRDEPSVHRIIPVMEAIPFEVEIHPYEQASALLEQAKSWGVRDCICRVQQKLIGKGCDRPLEACLAFAPVAGAFNHSEVDRAISKVEALEILRITEEAGLVHSTGNYRDGVNYICNCCTCCCGILRGVVEFGNLTAIARSDFHIVIDENLCTGCEECISRCQFNALSIQQGIAVVDDIHCMGCGLCATGCVAEALQLERRPAGEAPTPPTNIREWMGERIKTRGLSTSGLF